MTPNEQKILDELLSFCVSSSDDFEQRQKIQQERFEKIVEPTLTETQKRILKAPMAVSVPSAPLPSTLYTGHRKRISRCTKFLLFVVLPISAPLLLMVTAMALVEFFHIYLDFLRPLWIQLPAAPLYAMGLAIPGGLVAAYISCRMFQRELRRNK